MLGFAPEELETFLQALCAMAWADREVQAEERQLFEDLLAHLELAPEQKAKVSDWLMSPVSVDSIDWEPLSRDAREAVLIMAWKVAEADGHIHPGETTVMNTMAERMGLSANFLADVMAGKAKPDLSYLADLPGPGDAKNEVP